MKGWLHKEAINALGSSWKYRWFVFENGASIEYYTGEDMKDRKGNYQLSNGITCGILDNYKGSPTKFPFYIEELVKGKRERYVLAASTEADRQTWIDIITATVETLKSVSTAAVRRGSLTDPNARASMTSIGLSADWSNMEINVLGKPSKEAIELENAKKTIQILNAQLLAAGRSPLEYLPLEDIRKELEGIFEKVNSGDPYDEDRLDHLIKCMDYNPDYKKEKEAEMASWRETVMEYSRECLKEMRGFVPTCVFSSSLNELKAWGYSADLAKRIYNKKCLWLVRMKTDDLGTLHDADLLGRYGVESQGLDVIELCAIYAVAPAKFLVDPSGKKEIWRNNLEMQVKKILQEKDSGLLAKSKQRAMAYKNQSPLFLQDKGWREMIKTSSSGAFARRTSFSRLNNGDSDDEEEEEDEEDEVAELPVAVPAPAPVRAVSKADRRRSLSMDLIQAALKVEESADKSPPPAVAPAPAVKEQSRPPPPGGGLGFLAAIKKRQAEE